MSYYSPQQPSLDERQPPQQPANMPPPHMQQQIPTLNQQNVQQYGQATTGVMPPPLNQQLNSSPQTYNQEIAWNNNYRQQSIPQVTPRLNATSEFAPSPAQHQKGSLSPYGSPTSQFKNPWYNQKSPNLNSQYNSTNSISQASPLLQQTPTRQPFNTQLPTTYEHENMSPDVSRKNSIVLPPPSRAPAPPPTYFSDPNVHLNEPQRRQSIATVQIHQQQPQQQQHQQPIASGYQSQSPYYNMARRQSAFQYTQLKQLPAPQARRVFNKSDLKPVINPHPKYRRASMASQYISPLLSLTTDLCTTYSLCSPDFHYEVSKNPKRVLTKPSEGKSNDGLDNENDDYILYVNDVLGVQENRKYLVLDILGHGTFAQVVKCQNLITKELVAVKVVKSKSTFTNQSLSEIALLELINRKIDPHDQHHFLQLKDKFMHKNHLCLVFELLSSNLFELVKQNQYKGLSTKLVRNFTKQLLDSLCVLKDAKIIHCDLKPENILLISSDKPDIKVVDFGSACQESQTLYTYIQSRFYRSPEVILGLPYSTSIDTWSLGCIIAELFLGLPIFPGVSEYDQLVKIIAVLGVPPSWMIDMGKNSKTFFYKDNEGQYQLKPLDRYCKDQGIEENPGKKYIQTNDLDELIVKYTMNKKNMTTSMIDKENNDRASLVHLLKGLLNLSPLERWTPHQAILHPFVTEQHFTGDWNPPGTGIRKAHGGGEYHDLKKSAQGNQWFK
ncbi:CYFA0S02e08944g1_1 [Cyberlindnera fabianii]|uniref:CYFA0S02e08944g1_1 n=1 Tax=Cyberlindnera fabianii TaxID=36022 RepID=A0A061AP66_CYBFA|nr:CYFA0S02e08944g1_1 [Cyberlindnera fabianii]